MGIVKYGYRGFDMGMGIGIAFFHGMGIGEYGYRIFFMVSVSESMGIIFFSLYGYRKIHDTHTHSHPCSQEQPTKYKAVTSLLF